VRKNQNFKPASQQLAYFLNKNRKYQSLEVFLVAGLGAGLRKSGKPAAGLTSN